MKCTHVDLVYYKDTGKYYSQGELEIPYVIAQPPSPIGETRPVMFYEALQHVRLLLESGKRPGLVDGFDFDVLVTVYTEYGPLTHLFVRGRDRT